MYTIVKALKLNYYILCNLVPNIMDASMCRQYFTFLVEVNCDYVMSGNLISNNTSNLGPSCFVCKILICKANECSGVKSILLHKVKFVKYFRFANISIVCSAIQHHCKLQSSIINI